MTQLHHPCLSRLISLLSLNHKLLTAELLDLNGNNTLVITTVDRQGLAAHARVQDPLAGLNGNAAGAMQNAYQGFEGDLQRGRPMQIDADGQDLDELLQAKTARER